jgi:hypothetical protein
MAEAKAKKYNLQASLKIITYDHQNIFIVKSRGKVRLGFNDLQLVKVSLMVALKYDPDIVATLTQLYLPLPLLKKVFNSGIIFCFWGQFW